MIQIETPTPQELIDALHDFLPDEDKITIIKSKGCWNPYSQNKAKPSLKSN